MEHASLRAVGRGLSFVGIVVSIAGFSIVVSSGSFSLGGCIIGFAGIISFRFNLD